MKKHFLFLSAVALITLHSCSKEETPPPTTTTPPPTTTPTAPTPVTPDVKDVHGVLVSIEMDFSYANPAMPTMPISITSEIAVAAFPTNLNANTFAYAGDVSVNDNKLDTVANNTYYKMGMMGLTPASLSFSSGSNWNVAGSGGVSSFSYNHSVAFPTCETTLPTTVTKADGITISFDVSGADSVYVNIASGNTSAMKTVAGSATSVTFSAQELQGLTTVSDNTGMVQIAPVRINLQSINGKTYAFVKEKVITGSTNIN